MNDLEVILSQLAERTHDRAVNDYQGQNQRRNQVVDLFGMEQSSQGDTIHPATFWVSVSQDLVYYERFEFKIIISPFAMPLGSNGATGNSTVTVDNTSLATDGTSITPNPHTHTTQPHNHLLAAGVTMFTSSFSDLQMYIDDVNVTPYLMAQYDGAWITGEGVYPSQELLVNYDILKAVGYMTDWEQGAIVQPGYKKVELRANGVFNAKLVTYLKYSHINR